MVCNPKISALCLTQILFVHRDYKEPTVMKMWLVRLAIVAALNGSLQLNGAVRYVNGV